MREQLLSEAIRGYQFRGKIPFAPDFIRLFRKRYCVEFFYAVSFLCLHKKMYYRWDTFVRMLRTEEIVLPLVDDFVR